MTSHGRTNLEECAIDFNSGRASARASARLFKNKNNTNMI